jgi:hypothetical protein
MDSEHTTDAQPPAEKRYEFVAFISYKHEDMRWAKWLQNRLETYGIIGEKSRIKLLGNTRRGCGVKWLRDKEIWKVTGVNAL